MDLNSMREALEQSGVFSTSYPPPKDSSYFNEAAETRPRSEILKLQDEGLQRLVQWAYHGTEFNKQRFDAAGLKPADIKTAADLSKLPIFRRDEMREAQADGPGRPFGTMLAADAKDQLRFITKSTGTSGMPARQPWTPADQASLGEILGRSYWVSGIRPGMVFMGWIPMERSYVGSTFMALMSEYMGLVVAPEGPTVLMQEQEAAINYALELSTIGPLASYTSPLIYRMLGEAFKAQGVPSPMHVLMCAAMAVTPEMRAMLKDLHPNGTVTYQYGTTDGMTLAECNAGGGLHVWEDLLVTEIVDPETEEPVAEGERGELVVTFLGQLAQPMIRFGMEDIVLNKFNTEPCPCGRTHKRLESIVIGRTGDRFTVQGKELLPYDVDQVIVGAPETTGLYQISIESGKNQDAAIIAVETKHDLTDQGYHDTIRSALEKGMGVPVQLTLVEPGTVPVVGYKAQIVKKIK